MQSLWYLLNNAAHKKHQKGKTGKKRKIQIQVQKEKKRGQKRQ